MGYHCSMASIELRESLVARLAAQAAADGLTLEGYLERLAGGPAPCDARRLTSEELDRLLDEEAQGESTYQGTYSRADIYLDHD